MPSPNHNPFVPKIFPVTVLNSKILTLVPRYRSDCKRSGGRGGDHSCLFIPVTLLVANTSKPTAPNADRPPSGAITFCYFHKRWRDTRVVLNANRARRRRAVIDMPVLEDANSVQVSLMQI